MKLQLYLIILLEDILIIVFEHEPMSIVTTLVQYTFHNILNTYSLPPGCEVLHIVEEVHGQVLMQHPLKGSKLCNRLKLWLEMKEAEGVKSNNRF